MSRICKAYGTIYSIDSQHAKNFASKLGVKVALAKKKVLFLMTEGPKNSGRQLLTKAALDPTWKGGEKRTHKRHQRIPEYQPRYLSEAPFPLVGTTRPRLPKTSGKGKGKKKESQPRLRIYATPTTTMFPKIEPTFPRA